MRLIANIRFIVYTGLTASIITVALLSTPIWGARVVDHHQNDVFVIKTGGKDFSVGDRIEVFKYEYRDVVPWSTRTSPVMVKEILITQGKVTQVLDRWTVLAELDAATQGRGRNLAATLELEKNWKVRKR